MNNTLTSLYVLHSRPFKDSSVIVDCFSELEGLISLVVRGAKKGRSRLQSKMQPFILLQAAWMGRGELKTLTQVETQHFPTLSGAKIVLGLYLNELLVRLLQRFDPHPVLFQEYGFALNKLSYSTEKDKIPIYLRQFELKLLSELGYGLNLTSDGSSGISIAPELLYRYEPTLGMVEVSAYLPENTQVVVSGDSLIALREGCITNKVQLQESKKLMRFILAHYLGNKPLHSRKLFCF